MKAALTSLGFSRPGVNQHDQRRINLLARITGSRDALQQKAKESLETDPDLAARLHSLLLFAVGLRLHEIAESTGLTESTILRVRRRYELWGPHCIKDPQPRSLIRST